MKHRFTWVIVCTLFFQLLCTEVVYSNNDNASQYDCDRTFEPNVKGSVHVIVEITLGEPMSSYSFSFLEDFPVKKIEVWEEELGKKKDINIVGPEPEEDKMAYIFKFDTEKKKEFKFFIEFNQENTVRKASEEAGGTNSKFKNSKKQYTSVIA